MNILYITTGDILCNSSANFRNVSLIYGLMKNGHNVQIICMDHGKSRDDFFVKMLSDANLVYLNTHNRDNHSNTDTPVKTNKKKALILKLYNKFSVIDPYMYKIRIRSIKKIRNKITQPDLVISSSDPRSSHLLMFAIRKILQLDCLCVGYWGDPMLFDVSSSSLSKKLLRLAEKRIIKHCDYTVYTNSLTANLICKEYGIDPHRVFSIPTSSVLSQIHAENDSISIAESAKIRIGYFGEYQSKNRNMQPFLDTVRHNNNIELVIAGSTDYDVRSSFGNIIKYPLLPSSKVGELQQDVDILVVVENKAKDDICVQIPGKVFHYGLSNKKVLVIEETGIIRKEFGKFPKYRFCANNEKDIMKSIIELYEDSSQSGISPIDDFYPESVAKKLLMTISEKKY